MRLFGFCALGRFSSRSETLTALTHPVLVVIGSMKACSNSRDVLNLFLTSVFYQEVLGMVKRTAVMMALLPMGQMACW